MYPGILHVYAHPDDESFGNPATIMRYAADGAAMSLLTATHGEAGETGGVCDLAELGRVRAEELRAACRTLGIGRLELWCYPDGDLPGVDPEEAVARLMRLCREVRPRVIVTFGEDGITGHPDHVAVHRWATETFFRLRAEDGATSPDRLYYRAVPEWRRPLYPHRTDIIYRADCTTAVDGRAFPQARRLAAACHKTQRPHTNHADLALRAAGLVDCYVRRFPEWEGGPLEADLFGGRFHPEGATLP